MKLNKCANLLVIGLILCVAATGCRKSPQKVIDLPGGSRTGEVGGPGDGEHLGGTNGTGGDVTGEGTPSNPADWHKGWLEDAEALKAQTVYFDFDSSAIRANEQSKVSAVADYLKENSAKAVRVEGHCDERGTEEYNRALGERRALAVREELIRLGIDPTRVDTISYGKDRPAVMGSDESAWSKNRRDEFIVLTKPGS